MLAMRARLDFHEVRRRVGSSLDVVIGEPLDFLLLNCTCHRPIWRACCSDIRMIWPGSGKPVEPNMAS